MDREDSIIDFGECSSRTTQWVMENAVEGPDFETEVTEEYVVTDENLETHESMEIVQTQTASRIPKTLVVPGSSFAVPKSIPRRINPVVTVSGQDMAGRKFTPVKAIPLAEAQRLGLVGANGSRSPHVVVIKPGTPGPGFKVVTGQAQVKVMAGTPSSKPVHYVKLEPGRNGSPASHEMLSPNGVPLSSPSVSRAATRPSADDLSMPPPSPAKSTSGARQKGEVVMLTNPNYPRYAPSGYAASESGRESRLSVFSDLYSRADTLSPTPSVYGRNFENNGLKPRKPCNCNKSQCLKLYCECFANGEFCNNCNCLNCFNNLQHEEERQKAIKACLDRNINAFKPKITKAKGTTTERLHNKGCNCKRSGCLKNYCECFEAKIACSDKCKCLGCKNTEEAMCPNSAAKEEKLSKVVKATKTKTGEPKPPKSFGFMTQDVVEATCQCLLAQAEEAVLAARSQEETERLILEEYGRCLVQIIDYANKVKS